MSEGLKHKVVLVTGGAVRVGAGISRELAKRGATVAVHCYRHLEQANQLVVELGTGVALQADLTEPSNIARLFDAVEAAVGPVDLLVNNAGLIAETPLRGFELAVASRLLQLNTVAPMLLTAEFAERCAAASRRGAIVNIIDTAAERAWRHHAAYCASKSALLSLTRVAALELAPEIRVNAVSPGTVALRADEIGHSSRLLEGIPLERFGQPADVAQAVAFLAEAEWVTGAVIAVDGGNALT